MTDPTRIPRLIVVEDSPAMRSFVRAALEDRVEEILEASSGFEALRLLPRAPVDLAVVDVNMPDVNGLELVRFMRQREEHAKTPVLMISTEASARDVERGLALGADAYLAKPFTAEELLEAVEGLLGASS